MKIDLQDIVLVAVPENTKKYREYGVRFPNAQKDDFQLNRGIVWELGILNHQKNHFKPLREISEKAYYVVGEGCVQRSKHNIFTVKIDGMREIVRLKSPTSEMADWIEIKALHQKNKALIKSQLDPVLNAKIAENKKLARQKKIREELLKDRQEYLNF
ncbi:MAG: hypothetical protein IKV69_00535 [Clostridia bacterium]|nr:hypothetical protein [Clostridia bacterium]